MYICIYHIPDTCNTCLASSTLQLPEAVFDTYFGPVGAPGYSGSTHPARQVAHRHCTTNRALGMQPVGRKGRRGRPAGRGQQCLEKRPIVMGYFQSIVIYFGV